MRAKTNENARAKGKSEASSGSGGDGDGDGEKTCWPLGAGGTGSPSELSMGAGCVRSEERYAYPKSGARRAGTGGGPPGPYRRTA